MKDLIVIAIGIVAGAATWGLTQSDLAAGAGAIGAVILASAVAGKKKEEDTTPAKARKSRPGGGKR